MNIYVGNLSYEVTEEELRQNFMAFGEVSSVSIIKDKYSGQSKGFGFVEMPSCPKAKLQLLASTEKHCMTGRLLLMELALVPTAGIVAPTAGKKAAGLAAGLIEERDRRDTKSSSCHLYVFKTCNSDA